MSERPDLLREADVIELLVRQHRRILGLFDELGAATGDARVELFDRLRRFLTLHETIEEQIIHPFARRLLDGGDGIAETSLAAESEIKRLLADLERTGPGGTGSGRLLTELRATVERHFAYEEEAELPHIRRSADAEQLQVMAATIEAAEAMAAIPAYVPPGPRQPRQPQRSP